MRGRGITLEPLTHESAPALFDALDDVRVGRFIGGPDVTTIDALRERIAHLLAGPPPGSGQEWMNYVVVHDGAVIGRVEATVHDGIAEIAYVIGPRSWGHGWGTEAARLLLDHLASEDVTETWATAASGNVASCRLLRRLGFVETEAADAPQLLSYDVGDLVFRRVPVA